MTAKKTILYVCTEDWYFENHRSAHAEELIRNNFSVHVLCRAETDATARLRSHGVVVHHGDIARGSSPSSLIQEALKVRRTIRSVDPDVVHCIALKPSVIGALLVPTTRSRFILAVAGLGLSSVEGSFAAMSAVRLIRTASLSSRVRILFQNRNDQQVVSPYKGRSLLIESVGVDMKRFEVVPPPHVGAGPVIFTYLGRPVRSKGLQTLIDLDLEELPFEPLFRLYLSDDPTSPGVLTQQEITELGALSHVDVLPPTNNPQDAIADSHFGFLPSLAGEGVSKFSIETLACGRPLLTTATPGNDAVVSDGENGVLFAPGSANELRLALERCSEMLPKFDDIAIESRQRAEAKFSLDVILPEILALHQELV